MDDVSDRLLEALSVLDGVASQMTADEAPDRFDEVTLQVFWRDWPRLAAWAGALWRQLDVDLAGPSSSTLEPDFDELGGEG